MTKFTDSLTGVTQKMTELRSVSTQLTINKTSDEEVSFSGDDSYEILPELHAKSLLNKTDKQREKEMFPVSITDGEISLFLVLFKY